MIVARHPATHQPLTASTDATPQALCPYCGGVVGLRQRRRMSGKVVHFWRH